MSDPKPTPEDVKLARKMAGWAGAGLKIFTHRLACEFARIRHEEHERVAIALDGLFSESAEERGLRESCEANVIVFSNDDMSRALVLIENMRSALFKTFARGCHGADGGAEGATT